MAGGARLGGDDDDGGTISDINVTPLVDIILVVLIIFMVTAQVIMGRAIEVKSPETVSGEEVSSPLVLTLDEEVVLYLNGEAMADRGKVAEFIKAKVEEDKELQVIITADKAVPHGDVMALVDLVKLAGVKNLAFTTIRPPKGNVP